VSVDLDRVWRSKNKVGPFPKSQEEPGYEKTPWFPLSSHYNNLARCPARPAVRQNFIAFQMARVGDPAGVGLGIFIYDLDKAAQRKPKSSNTRP